MTAQLDNLRAFSKILSIAALSAVLHASFLWYTARLAARYAEPDWENFVPIHLTRDDPPPPVAEPKAEDHPAPVKTPVLKKAKVPRKAHMGPLKKIPLKTVPPVQGLPPDALSKAPNGMAVPIGNSTMTGDEGKRLKSEDYKALPKEQDLSTQPQLVHSSVELPAYTTDALDNNIEGTFEVDVYVDESGEVSKAELKRSIGYGMDERVLAAARKVHFVPGKDRYGKEIGEWTEIKFRLQIP